MEKLGKNLGGYHGETIDIRAMLRDIQSAAQQHGWSSELFYKIGDLKLFALNRAPLAIRNPQSEFISAPASTATNRRGRSRRCVCFRKTNGRPTRNFGCCPA